MLATSSTIMAVAWLGHLRFKDDLHIAAAMLIAWLMVLPEYALNIAALRLGYRSYSGGQMAAFRLCSGVVCVALVSRFVLGETLSPRKWVGFALMTLAMTLIASTRKRDARDSIPASD
jgi:uncharacterized protein (DUF486 family)